MDYSLPPDTHLEYSVNHYEQEKAHLVKSHALGAMIEIDGWCSIHRASFLIDLIVATQPQVIVEIGVFAGKSLIPMALALHSNGSGKVYGIDSWDTSTWAKGMDGGLKHFLKDKNYEQAKQSLIEKISSYNLENYVVLHHATSMDAPVISEIDILTIDRNSYEEEAFQELCKWVPHVKKGGLVILNNVSWTKDGLVNPIKATEWLNQSCSKQAHFGGKNEWAIWLKL